MPTTEPDWGTMDAEDIFDAMLQSDRGDSDDDADDDDLDSTPRRRSSATDDDDDFDELMLGVDRRDSVRSNLSGFEDDGDDFDGYDAGAAANGSDPFGELGIDESQLAADIADLEEMERMFQQEEVSLKSSIIGAILVCTLN